MEHYICLGGCGGVSDKPGVCQDPTCPDYGKPLVAHNGDNIEDHHKSQMPQEKSGEHKSAD